MEQKPLISIVLPTYNGQWYLEESVESCLNQTFLDWELIIVDDCSTDRTPEIIARLAQRDSRIRCVRNEANKRLPASLNRGFSEARGSYLTWTSDDNLYRPKAIKEMVEFLQTHPDIDLVYADYTEIDPDGLPVRPVAVRDPRLLPFENVVGPCFLYRRVVMDALGGYEEDLFLAEDYDYWLRTSSRFHLARIPKDLYCYRNHSGSLTAQRVKAIAEVHEQAVCRNLPRMDWLGLGAKALAFLDLAGRAQSCHRHPAAKKLLLLAIKTSPGVIFHRQRIKWVEQIVSEADPALASVHRAILSSSVSSGSQLLSLSAFAVFGDVGVRWSYRLMNAYHHPVTVTRKAIRRILSLLRGLRLSM